MDNHHLALCILLPNFRNNVLSCLARSKSQALAKSADVRFPVRNPATGKRSFLPAGSKPPADETGAGLPNEGEEDSGDGGAERGAVGEHEKSAAAGGVEDVVGGWGDFDEGAVDMIEANNKPSRKSLWTRCAAVRMTGVRTGMG